ncbi:hypothetical protein R5R35_009550 [Gryllus longicercus]|uniref:Uncharacterized protein n=1 Tax=Gryllus longicercus TaxID=2509291 RepID=A0AAN9VUB4_9ORTH
MKSVITKKVNLKSSVLTGLPIGPACSTQQHLSTTPDTQQFFLLPKRVREELLFGGYWCQHGAATLMCRWQCLLSVLILLMQFTHRTANAEIEQQLKIMC